jgi:hypothetical protein
MVPRERPPEHLDVAAALDDPPVGHDILLQIYTGPDRDADTRSGADR